MGGKLGNFKVDVLGSVMRHTATICQKIIFSTTHTAYHDQCPNGELGEFPSPVTDVFNVGN